ncbi:MAG: hypothetical protein M0P27_00565 [Bacteroidales bacterium]|nr:hypothetical protein [Bacteroidales bacterium]
MFTKQIIILANSIKKGHFCIAGREIKEKPNTNNVWQVGKWIRPISEHGEGEVSKHESEYTDGSQPLVLDVAKIPLKAKGNIPFQPEDFLIDVNSKWEKTDHLVPDLSKVIEKPRDLWEEPGSKINRVSERYLKSCKSVRSIYLIKPEDLKFQIWKEHHRSSDTVKKKRRAIFIYNGCRYDLGITDPVIGKKYFDDRFPALTEDKLVIQPENSDQCLIVVSLTPRFRDGNHYKVVATIIEY